MLDDQPLGEYPELEGFKPGSEPPLRFVARQRVQLPELHLPSFWD